MILQKQFISLSYTYLVDILALDLGLGVEMLLQ